jgi:hypothetical protein
MREMRAPSAGRSGTGRSRRGTASRAEPVPVSNGGGGSGETRSCNAASCFAEWRRNAALDEPSAQARESANG